MTAAEPIAVTYPELFVGIAGPIGIDVDLMSAEISAALTRVGYKAATIHVTKLMPAYSAANTPVAGDDYFSQINQKIAYANKLCEQAADPAFMMRIAMQGIIDTRDELGKEGQPEVSSEFEADADDSSIAVVKPHTAYIIRQLKRPEEVALMRTVYGKQFILVSGYGSEEHRRARILEKGRASLPISTPGPELEQKVADILERDHDEGTSKHVQHLRDTFHLADVFVDGINRDQMRNGIDRFFQAFFGRTDIGPTKSEYGMYSAKAASLRSTDLSRQVGAAVLTNEGDLISQGCNEVPKAFGGSYWFGEEPDHRDVRLGYDPNDALKKDVIRDLLERLAEGKLLNEDAKKIAMSEKFVDQLLGRGEPTSSYHGCLDGSQIGDLTEYGRVVHAEMSAICDAARLGRALRDATLYVTTFPCHNCTKHILSVGIKRVVYMEPYPKSRAKQLHSNEIEIEKISASKVSFVPFLGISPYRYRDIFEKSSRKTLGSARTWYDKMNHPRPMVSVTLPTYLDAELTEVAKIGGSFIQTQEMQDFEPGLREATDPQP